MVNAQSRALLVGCGSIGKTHLRELLARFAVVTVVDPAAAARDWAIAEADRIGTGETARLITYSSLEAVLADSDFAPYDIATIANWGPDHAVSIRALLARGQRSFVIEKPLADSIADAREILTEIDIVGGTYWLNFTRRYSGMPGKILDLAVQHNLGDLKGMTVTGGARCIGTNGIHFLDLAIVLFSSLPTTVTADLETQHINPRHPSLTFVEGVIDYRFPSGGRFNCVLLNGSSVAENVRLYWRDAEGELMPGGDFVLRLRAREQVERFPAVTRTGQALDEVFRGNLWSTQPNETRLAMLYNAVVTKERASEGGSTTEYLLAALHSSDLGRRLSLPIDGDLINTTKHWGIS